MNFDYNRGAGAAQKSEGSATLYKSGGSATLYKRGGFATLYKSGGSATLYKSDDGGGVKSVSAGTSRLVGPLRVLHFEHRCSILIPPPQRSR